MTDLRLCTKRSVGFASVAAFAATVCLTSAAFADGGDGPSLAVTLTGPMPITDSGDTCNNANSLDILCNFDDNGNFLDDLGSPDDWYIVSFSTDVIIDLSLCGSGCLAPEVPPTDCHEDTQLWVLSTDLTLVYACDDDSCPSGERDSIIECLPLAAGTYFVVVDGWYDDTTPESFCGVYDLTIDNCLPCDVTVVCVGSGETTEVCTDEYGDGVDDQQNGGCDAGGIAWYEDIICGQTRCGTQHVWEYTSGTDTFIRRDVDVYLLDLSAETQNLHVIATVTAEYPTEVALIEHNPTGDGSCATETGFLTPFSQTGLDCAVNELDLGCILPGYYYLWVSPGRDTAGTFAWDCAGSFWGNDYEITVACTEPGCEPPPSECPEPSATGHELSESTSQTITNGVRCGSQENYYARNFDLSAAAPEGVPGTDIEVYCVEYAVFQAAPAGGVIPGDVSIYEDTNGGAPEDLAGDIVLLGTVGVLIPGNVSGIYTAVFTTPVPVDADVMMTVELHYPANTQDLIGGGNGLLSPPELGPTYLKSAPCGVATYVDTAAIGFPDSNIILNVFVEEASGSCFGDIAPPGGDGSVGVADLLELLGQWGTTGGSADFDGGGVGVSDLLALLGVWGPCP